VVAQVYEEQMTVIALAMDPSRKADRFADVAEAKLGAAMGSIGVHDDRLCSSGNFVEKVAPRFNAGKLFVNPRGRG
jgi:hypothetical protein